MIHSVVMQRYVAVGLFFASTLFAPAVLTAVTTDKNQWTVAAASGVMSVIATVVGVGALTSWESRRRRRTLVSIPTIEERAALIVTAGPKHFSDRRGEPSLLFLQLHQCRPGALAIIGSQETLDARPDFDACLAGLPHEITPSNVRWFLLADPDAIDRQAFDQALSWALDEERVSADRLAIDVTGGTTTMSLSGLVAATAAGVDCQVVRQDGSGGVRILDEGR